MKNAENIIALKTINDNDVFDSYLLMPDKKISIFEDGEILTPVYKKDIPINRKRVSLNDLEFIKCIGKGGSSEVYLGNSI